MSTKAQWQTIQRTFFHTLFLLIPNVHGSFFSAATRLPLFASFFLIFFSSLFWNRKYVFYINFESFLVFTQSDFIRLSMLRWICYFCAYIYAYDGRFPFQATWHFMVVAATAKGRRKRMNIKPMRLIHSVRPINTFNSIFPFNLILTLAICGK